MVFSDLGHTSRREQSRGETHPEPFNGLLNIVARFEVSRLNQGQPVFHRVAMEYEENNAYEALENPYTDYDMQISCFIQLLS